jgi:N-acetylneuraminic acid mutarotase
MTANAPEAQGLAEGAAWTGREMLVLTTDGQFIGYDPAGNRWRIVDPPPLRPRARPAIAWTGSAFVVWGGCDSGVGQCDDLPANDEFTDGAAYDPATDTWRLLPPAPLGSVDRPQATWTGREVVIWGGTPRPDKPGAYGAAYDPGTNRWRTIAQAPIGPRSNHTMIWTGSQMLVWGGEGAGNDGAAYDPAHDRWTPPPAAPIRSRDRHVAAWAGDRMLVWGGCCANDRPFADGAAYIP